MVTCEECRAAFAALEKPDPAAPDLTRAERLDQLHPFCACQTRSVSPHSAGKIAEAETLVRIIVSPQHVDKKGNPRAAALSAAETHGLSMLRESASNEEILFVATGLVTRARAGKTPKAGVLGVLNVTCASFRKFICEGEDSPCYCVYDTALLQLPAHVEGFQRVAGVEAQMRDLRRKNLFGSVKGGFVSVAEFRSGLLRGLAPLP